MRRFSSSWYSTLARLGFKRARRSFSYRNRRSHARLGIESLEPRQMLSNDPIVVTTLEDQNDGAAGGMSVRDAIAKAYTDSGDDVIEFDPSLFTSVPVAITLTHGGADEGPAP